MTLRPITPALLLAAACQDTPAPAAPGTDAVQLSIIDAHPSMPCLNETFTQLVEVFGMYVIATEGAPADYVLHTANVLAQYIDNDEDGRADDEGVLRHLVDNRYVVPVWRADERETFWASAQGTECEDGLGMAASMYYDGDAWALGGLVDAGTWDTNLEEVWHVVSVGWYETYPDDFGVELDPSGAVIPSSLTEATDAARGGQLLTTPDTYPEEAWYTYDDGTCGYPCQVHEYFYWIVVSNIGALSPEHTDKCDGIQDEWRICTPDELAARDARADQLLNREGFALPTRIPDGSYQHP